MTRRLFNRVVVFVTSGALLIALFVNFNVPKFRNDLDIVKGFLIVTFALIASVGVWINLNYRNRAPEEEDEFQAVGRPTIPNNAIVCPFFTGIKSASLSDWLSAQP